jgi:hypothetical protein
MKENYNIKENIKDLILITKNNNKKISLKKKLIN